MKREGRVEFYRTSCFGKNERWLRELKNTHDMNCIIIQINLHTRINCIKYMLLKTFRYFRSKISLPIFRRRIGFSLRDVR